VAPAALAFPTGSPGSSLIKHLATGHMMMLEKNNMEIAKYLNGWISKATDQN
jgi:hypothetical protein